MSDKKSKFSMKILKFALPVFFAVFLLAVLFSRVEMGTVYETVRTSNKSLLLLSLFVLIFAHAVGAFRWKIILKMLDYEVHYTLLLKLYLANIPISKITPFYGGDFMRVYYLKDKVPRGQHAGGIFMGMILDIAILAVLMLIGGILVRSQIIYLFGLAVISAIAALYIGTPLVRKIVPRVLKTKVENFFYAFSLLIKKPKLAGALLLSTFITWFLVMIYIKLVFLSFSSDVAFLPIIAFQSAVTLISLAPITIWGVGTREAVMLVLFSALAQRSVILAVGLTYSFVGAVLLPILFIPLTYKVIKEMSRGS